VSKDLEKACIEEKQVLAKGILKISQLVSKEMHKMIEPKLETDLVFKKLTLFLYNAVEDAENKPTIMNLLQVFT
jgi:hypothetical protein